MYDDLTCCGLTTVDSRDRKVVTLAGGLLSLVALRAGTALESRAQRAYTAATEELDDRLFEFAWAQPSLRTARNLSLGNRLVTICVQLHLA